MGKKETVYVLQPVEVKSVTSTVMERLEDGILSGQLAEGQKLPSEHELAVQAGVGRRAIREALKALEMKGLITIRKGSGAFVVRNDFDSYMDTLVRNVQAYLKLDRAKLRHMLQFRELLAGSIIGLLAAQPTKTTVAAMEAALKRQEEAYASKSTARYTKAHLDFHFAIINSAGNPIATMMYTQVIKLLEPYMKKASAKPSIIKSSIKEHRAILDAVKNGDPAEAQRAFHSHMEISMAHLEEILASAR